jgi:ATP-dependent RNA helicase DeaD
MIKLTSGRIRRERVPSIEEVEEKRTNATFELLRETLEGGEFPKRDALVDRLLDQGHAPTDIASALLHLLTSATRKADSDPEDQGFAQRERPERPERSERSSRGRRERPSDRSEEAGMTRLVFTVGRQDGVRPADFVGKIASLAGVDREGIGAIHIDVKHTLVDVADAVVARVIRKLNGMKFRAKRVSVFLPKD